MELCLKVISIACLIKKPYLKNNKDKSDHHEVYTEENNKIVLSNNDYKRLQTFDGIETYPHRANPYIVCKSEMMISRYFFVEKYTDCPFYSEIVPKRQRWMFFNK